MKTARPCSHSCPESGMRQPVVQPYLNPVKSIIMMTARILMLAFSAFWMTLPRQYRNAASHKNHSKKAASITLPTTATYTICTLSEAIPRVLGGVTDILDRPWIGNSCLIGNAASDSGIQASHGFVDTKILRNFKRWVLSVLSQGFPPAKFEVVAAAEDFYAVKRIDAVDGVSGWREVKRKVPTCG
jgi:hypothetical protein